MKKWYHDYGLQARMIFTMFLLAVVYLIFLAVILIYGGGGTFVLILVSGFFLFL